MGVDKPNYTQIPNLILDHIMRYMDGAELKVTLAIARHTFGYHRERVELTITQIEELTGLSRPAVTGALDVGIRRNMIERVPTGNRSYAYALVVNDEVLAIGKESLPIKDDGQDIGKESLPSSVKKVYRDSKESLPTSVKKVTRPTPTLKKVLKKDLKKEDTATQHPHAADDVDFIPDPKPTEPVPEKTLTPQQAMYGAICEALGWDYHVIAERERVRVAQTVKILSKAEPAYTVDDIRHFMTQIWFRDWRWEKHGQYPTLEQLRQEIGKTRSLVPAAAPPPKAKGIDSWKRLAANIGATT